VSYSTISLLKLLNIEKTIVYVEINSQLPTSSLNRGWKRVQLQCKHTFDELLLLTDFHRPDVICITESWLCLDILDSEISIPGFQTMRLDRNRHGGGVLMYVSDKYIVKRLPSHASLELLTVTLIVVIIDPVCHCFIVLLAHQLIFCILFTVILSQ